MKIFNIMFQKKLGGIEQAFLDYNTALTQQGFEVVPIIHPKALIRSYLSGPYRTIYNFNSYDILAILKLYNLIRREKPDCIITHGGRAANLIKKVKMSIPFIAVSHNYNFKPLLTADAIIALTEDMHIKLAKTSFIPPTPLIYTLPNMISLDNNNTNITNFRNPPIIGMIGRFSNEKGIDVLLKALKILKLKNIPFKAKLAGDGEKKAEIQKMIVDFGLSEHVELLGWVDNKKAFYNDIDIFCLTSYHESFGIVVLEAFKYAKPSIITTTPGPMEIATNNLNAILVPIGDYAKAAQALVDLISDTDKAKSLAQAAFLRACDYSIATISSKLRLIVEEVCHSNVKNKSR